MPGLRFLFLPTEVRLQIYEHILDAAEISTPLAITGNQQMLKDAKSPVTIALEEYSGLILSCKQVKSEFEHEWVKVFNAWLYRIARLARLTPNTLPPDATLREAHYVKFEASIDYASPTPTEPIIILMGNLKSFTIRPDHKFPADDDVGVPSWMKTEVLHRLEEDCKTCGTLLRMKRLVPEETSFTMRHYWPHSVTWCRISKSPLSKTKHRLADAPSEKNPFDHWFWYIWLLTNCDTFEELGEYRGLMYASRAHYSRFRHNSDLL